MVDKTDLEALETGCSTAQQFVDLARSVLAAGGSEYAKILFEKAAGYCDDIEQTVACAGAALELFNDRDQVRSILEDAETDAQFAKQYVDLARGFKVLLDDDQKVDELLESGAEFAMGGEEFIDLANGYWNLKQDKQTASGLYEKGLPDVNDRDTLLALAKTVAKDLENPNLAKTIYSKAESRVTGPGELIKLADSINRISSHNDLTGRLLDGAAEMASDYLDLSSLAKANMDAGNHDASASLFEQAARSCTTPGDLQSLVMRMRRYGVDNEKVKSVYLAAESSFTDKYDLLQWAEGLIDLFDDRESAEEIFREIADKFNQPGDRSVFQNREMYRFEAGQDYLKPIRCLTN